MWRLLVSEAVSLWLISMETCSNSGFLRLFLHWKLCSFQWYIICVYTLQGGYFLLFPKNSAVSGRVFIRWLIDFTVGIRKRHHYIQCCRQLKKKRSLSLADIFLPFQWKKNWFLSDMFFSPIFPLYTDAAKWTGFGAILGYPTFWSKWASWWKEQNITLLELVPTVLVLETSGQLLHNSVVTLHTDNAALVSVINEQTSKAKYMMVLAQQFVVALLLFNILCQAQHVTCNEICNVM